MPNEPRIVSELPPARYKVCSNPATEQCIHCSVGLCDLHVWQCENCGTALCLECFIDGNGWCVECNAAKKAKGGKDGQ